MCVCVCVCVCFVCPAKTGRLNVLEMNSKFQLLSICRKLRLCSLDFSNADQVITRKLLAGPRSQDVGGGGGGGVSVHRGGGSKCA